VSIIKKNNNTKKHKEFKPSPKIFLLEPSNVKREKTAADNNK